MYSSMFNSLMDNIRVCVSAPFAWLDNTYAVFGLSFFFIFSGIIFTRFMVKNFVRPFL